MTQGTGEEALRGSAVLGIDVGGTTISVDLVDLSGELLASSSFPTGRGAAALEGVLGHLAAMREEARRAGARLLGVGLLSPGHVDEVAGAVRFASNLGWRDLQLRAQLEEVLVGAAAEPPVPAAVGQDVRWSGVAEGAWGAARGLEDYALVSVGTGIAACLVSGGEVLSGASGSAGEFGHATVFPGGDRCACGRIGCVDAYFSGAALARRYRSLGGARDDADAATVLASLPDPSDVSGRSDAGDPVAERVADEGVEALARGLCSLTLTMDPGTIVISGGLSRAGDALLAPLRARLEAQLVWKDPPELVISPLGDRAGRAGALLLALDAAGQRHRASTWGPRLRAQWDRLEETTGTPAAHPTTA